MKRKHAFLIRTAVTLIIAIIAIAVILTQPDDQSAKTHCTDTDGTNLGVRGQTYDWRSGMLFQDKCVDSRTVEEYGCEYTALDLRGKTTALLYACKHGCVDGICGTPDLVVTDMHINREPTTKDEFKVTFVVANQGNIRADTVDMTAYFEPGYGIMIEPPRPIMPGETTIITYSVTYKVPGTFKVTTILDPYDLLQESNEENNQRTDIIQVKGLS